MIKKHLHIFTRVKHKTRKDLYKCRDPHCTFRGNTMYIEGRAAQCIYCGKEYVVTAAALRLKNPHCEDCTTTAVANGKASAISQGAIEEVAKAINVSFLTK